jgi:hypothetical protein
MSSRRDPEAALARAEADRAAVAAMRPKTEEIARRAAELATERLASSS